MARALLGYTASTDQLLESDNARLRARVQELQQRVERLDTEVRGLRAEAEARRVVDAHLNDTHLTDEQFDRLTRDEMAGSPA